MDLSEGSEVGQDPEQLYKCDLALSSSEGHYLVDTWLDLVPPWAHSLATASGSVSGCSEKAEGVPGPKGGAGRVQENTPNHARLHSHIIEEVAGVDGDAETLCPCALRAQAVQHIRDRAHDAYHHCLALLEEAIEEGWQLTLE